MDDKCRNCDHYNWDLSQCNVEGTKPCEEIIEEKPAKKSPKKDQEI